MAPIARLRAAAIGVVTFASLAAAAATAQHQGWFAMLRGHVSVRTGSAAAASAPKLASPPVTQPGPLPGETPVEASQPTITPIVKPSDLAAHAGPEPARRSAEARAPRAGNAQAESVLMMEAVRALRRDGDAVRSQALADEVLRRFPRGAQVEEAMILSMDASTARGDDAAARRAAVRYLERFPTGRFVDRARRVVAGARDGE